MTVIDGQWALVLSGATGEHDSHLPGTRDSAVAFLCPLDKSVIEEEESSGWGRWRDLWGPWCNLPLPPLTKSASD
ncbi:hypothetical protein KDL01_41055 [Actinospica durhamensis]|uniref:Uncharacterized protein n=1 Tax=Actinospica durhamensis TaxID=1508375 RepID=A0A941IWN4_9ACTN|nr:hypothetical protein [Actinospica durhamensis]MBR7839711.1 hypothetical protein [Actinospica durhamensis]